MYHSYKHYTLIHTCYHYTILYHRLRSACLMISDNKVRFFRIIISFRFFYFSEIYFNHLFLIGSFTDPTMIQSHRSRDMVLYSLISKFFYGPLSSIKNFSILSLFNSYISHYEVSQLHLIVSMWSLLKKKSRHTKIISTKIIRVRVKNLMPKIQKEATCLLWTNIEPIDDRFLSSCMRKW